MLNLYKKYFSEFNRLAVGKYADLSYGNPSPNPTAGSYESIIAYADYIKNTGGVVLNSGAGASSWMLRSIFDGVICNDPNPHFLEFVKYVCENNGIYGGEYLVGFDGIKCDHVYYDYGDIERMPNLINAINCAEKSIYVDDTNYRPECAEYRDFTINLCKELGLRCADLHNGFDKDGRGGLLIEK